MESVCLCVCVRVPVCVFAWFGGSMYVQVGTGDT